MLWSRKPRAVTEAPDAAGAIVPAALAVSFDAALFARHYAALPALLGGGEGVAPAIAALEAKQRRFAQALARAAAPGGAALLALLAEVFSARRRLRPALAALDEAQVQALAGALMTGAAPLADRLAAFADGFAELDTIAPPRAGRLRGAAWDFAAELLHYADPERVPLMSRWVWDAHQQSGALREFVAGGDAGLRLPIPATPEAFAAARIWIVERLREEGLYRSLPLWADLVLGCAYAQYFRAVTGGVLGADFTRALRPGEELTRLLGIAGARAPVAPSEDAHHAHP